LGKILVLPNPIEGESYGKNPYLLGLLGTGGWESSQVQGPGQDFGDEIYMLIS